MMPRCHALHEAWCVPDHYCSAPAAIRVPIRAAFRAVVRSMPYALARRTGRFRDRRHQSSCPATWQSWSRSGRQEVQVTAQITSSAYDDAARCAKSAVLGARTPCAFRRRGRSSCPRPVVNAGQRDRSVVGAGHQQAPSMSPARRCRRCRHRLSSIVGLALAAFQFPSRLWCPSRQVRVDVDDTYPTSRVAHCHLPVRFCFGHRVCFGAPTGPTADRCCARRHAFDRP